MPLTELSPDPKTGRRRFRGHLTDGKPASPSGVPKKPDLTIRVQVQQPAAPKRATVRDAIEEKPKLSGPAEAFWPADDYLLRPDGDDLAVYERTPSGEEREVKRYDGARFASEKVGSNYVVRRRAQSMADRNLHGEQLRQQRLRDQARLEEMNRANREKWARARGGAE